MLLQVLLFVAFVVAARPSSVALHSSEDSTENKTTNISQTNQATRNSSLSTQVQYRCDGPRFGYNLNPRSCLQAWSFIPWSMTAELTFGERDEAGTYDVGLPKRYLSCKCRTLKIR